MESVPAAAIAPAAPVEIPEPKTETPRVKTIPEFEHFPGVEPEQILAREAAQPQLPQIPRFDFEAAFAPDMSPPLPDLDTEESTLGALTKQSQVSAQIAQEMMDIHRQTLQELDYVYQELMRLQTAFRRRQGLY